MLAYNYILATVCFLFSIFAVHLLFAKNNNRQLSWLLATILTARIGQIIVFLCAKNNEIELFSYAYRVLVPLLYMAPPALFLYVARFLNPNFKIYSQNWLHFLPFLLAVIHFLPITNGNDINWAAVLAQVANEKQAFMVLKTGIFPATVFSSFRILLIFFYLSLAWYSYIKSPMFAQKQLNKSKLWIILVLTGSSIFQFIGVLPVIINYRHSAYSWFLATNCIGLVILLLYILHRPSLLYSFLLVKVKSSSKTDAKVAERNTKKSKDGLPLAAVNLNTQITKEDLNAVMENKKMYLQTGLQIKDLANVLEVPVHHCSLLINTLMEKNFRDWVNWYRIHYFIENYQVKKQNLTIEALAKEAGFNSLATFYNAFKKETGLMPKQFFKEKN